jgi:hypothetical protein
MPPKKNDRAKKGGGKEAAEPKEIDAAQYIREVTNWFAVFYTLIVTYIDSCKYDSGCEASRSPCLYPRRGGTC